MANLRGKEVVETLKNKTLNDPGSAKPAYVSKLQVVGSKITSILRAAGNITVTALAAGAEEDQTIAVTGAAVGDLVLVSPSAAPQAGWSIALAWVSASNTVTIRSSNLGTAALTAGTQAVVVLVIKSQAADT